MKKLIENKIKCLGCDTILVSIHRHDFVMCDCENTTFVDGGLVYQRIGGKDLKLIENLSVEEEHLNVHFSSMHNFKLNFNNDEFLSKYRNSICISIVTEESEKFDLNKNWKKGLQLVFEDTDNEKDLNCFSFEQAEQIINYIDTYKNMAENLYVHCLMGISRSAAIALFIEEMILGRTVEDIGRSKYANYNRFIYNRLMTKYRSIYFPTDVTN